MKGTCCSAMGPTMDPMPGHRQNAQHGTEAQRFNTSRPSTELTAQIASLSTSEEKQI